MVGLKRDSAGSADTGSEVHSLLLRCLEECLSPIIARSALAWACKEAGIAPSSLGGDHIEALSRMLERCLPIYVDPVKARSVVQKLRAVRLSQSAAVNLGPVRVVIAVERDVLAARVACKQLARDLGFHEADAVKIATVVSELARNIVQYAASGTLSVTPLGAPREGVELVARDEGPGIADLDAILKGAYRSHTGMGVGLKGSARLMDTFEVQSAPGAGTKVIARKYLRPTEGGSVHDCVHHFTPSLSARR